MPAQSLHPNLARLAAAYDDIIERYTRRQISPSQARGEIMALVARDDNGTMWSIDPDSGQWLYRNIQSQLIPSDPPSYGLATPTSHDLSNNPNAFNPDTKIAFNEVDESLLNPPNSLIGSTRRPQENDSMLSSLLSSAKTKAAAAVIVGGALAAIVVKFI